MLKAYITLAGEKIDLSHLTPEARTFLGHVVKAYEESEAYPNFVNKINSPGSPALGKGRWITEKVAASHLYRVCQDLADRLGIAQGFLALGEQSSLRDAGFTERREPDYVSSEEAAQLLGVTAEAIRKAIREKRIPARQVGRTYLIERRAVEGYAHRAGHKLRDLSPAMVREMSVKTYTGAAKRRRAARRPH
jgi:excisionase family DNA binding protein